MPLRRVRFILICSVTIICNMLLLYFIYRKFIAYSLMLLGPLKLSVQVINDNDIVF